MSDVKRYTVPGRYLVDNGKNLGAQDVVLATDYATLEAENANLRAVAVAVAVAADFSQFLTAVMDAAGLVRHGRQSKELAEYLGSQCMKYRLAAAPQPNDDMAKDALLDQLANGTHLDNVPNHDDDKRLIRHAEQVEKFIAAFRAAQEGK